MTADDDDGLESLRVDRVADALATFDGSDGERRAVARAVRDLVDSGRLYEDRDTEAALTVDDLLGELRDAPGGGPAERWNWWVGSLDLAYGGYNEFRVLRYDATGDGDGE